MPSATIRIYRVALELDVPPRVVLEVGQRLGFDVKNSLSSLSTEQRALIEQNLPRHPPDEPPLGVPSKIGPRGPRPSEAHEE